MRLLLPTLLILFLGVVYCLPTLGQDQPPLGDVARQARASKSLQPKKATKIITNDNLDEQSASPAIAQSPKSVEIKDTVITVFLHRIAGRWNFAYVRKGSQRWWPDHGMSRPKNEIHYLFGPKDLLVESRLEFSQPCIIDRFVYGSVRKVSAELFDLELRKPSEPAAVEIRRVKFSPGGKTMEIASDAEGNPEPSIQVLELVDAITSTGETGDRTCG